MLQEPATDKRKRSQSGCDDRMSKLLHSGKLPPLKTPAADWFRSGFPFVLVPAFPAQDFFLPLISLTTQISKHAPAIEISRS